MPHYNIKKGKKMKKQKEQKINTQIDMEALGDEQKRAFIKKYGKFAASAPAIMFLLMTAGTSKAHAGSATNSDMGI